MKLPDFNRYYPNEDACKKAFKEIRIENDVGCPRCGSTHHYWKSGKEMFQCAKCCRIGRSLLHHCDTEGSERKAKM